MICDEEYVKRRDAKPMGRIVSWAYAGVEPEIMGIGPVPATRQAWEKAGLKLSTGSGRSQRAFAAQYLAVEKELGWIRTRNNVNGGAIALGNRWSKRHSYGDYGVNELRRRGGRYGLRDCLHWRRAGDRNDRRRASLSGSGNAK